MRLRPYFSKRSKKNVETQCFWYFYILLHTFKEKTIFFSRTSLLRTLNLPPRASAITGVDSPPAKLLSFGGTVDSKSSLVCHLKKTVLKFQRRTLK